jgi:plastocyanin
MNRVVLMSVLVAMGAAPIACEGEPPITPADLPAAPASAELAAEEPSAVPSARPVPSATPSATAVGSAAPSASPATAVPAAPAQASVTGTVATMPASMASFAVVWLEDGPPDAAPPKTVSVDNRMMTFIPFVQVVAVGGKVIFSNSDPFPHNVFTPDNERWNLGNVPQHGASVRVFKQPTTYALLCNLHPGMLGYLVVTPSSWFMKATKGGAFTMKDVPAGTYKMTAWAPRQTPVTQTITVGASDVSVHFELHRP